MIFATFAKILIFLDIKKPYNILNWLAVLTKHRTYWQNSSISAEAKVYLQEYFYVDVSVYDVVIGYRADDGGFDVTGHPLPCTWVLIPAIGS